MGMRVIEIGFFIALCMALARAAVSTKIFSALGSVEADIEWDLLFLVHISDPWRMGSCFAGAICGYHYIMSVAVWAQRLMPKTALLTETARLRNKGASYSLFK